jgi:protein-L-isoaspartate(D-aspartate) O-methyltransferase
MNLRPAVLLFTPLFVAAQDPTREPRERMVRDQIEKRGVKNSDVLKVMREVPRHLFMPEQARGYAYNDAPAAIGHGATISQPYIVALMTELLEPNPKLKVLEIGTGSGYQAAILAKLARRVYTIEIVPELAASSAATLKKLGYENVEVRTGDGYKGWPEQAPFDRIILTAAPPEIPKALIGQLANGGRLVAPEGAGFHQLLIVLDKSASGSITRRAVAPVAFVPMKH